MKFALTTLLLAAASASAQTIVDLAVATPDLSTLVELVTSAGLVETLSGEGPLTVFAPTNAAFAGVDADTLAMIGADTELLTKVLTYHVVAGNVTSADLVAGPVAMVSGDEATVSLDPVMIDGANVITADIMASNGVVHVIDAIILPASLDLTSMMGGNVTDGMEETEETEAPAPSSAFAAKSVMALTTAAAAASMLF